MLDSVFSPFATSMVSHANILKRLLCGLPVIIYFTAEGMRGRQCRFSIWVRNVKSVVDKGGGEIPYQRVNLLWPN